MKAATNGKAVPFDSKNLDSCAPGLLSFKVKGFEA
jgi:hypothetical protein